MAVRTDQPEGMSYRHAHRRPSSLLEPHVAWASPSRANGCSRGWTVIATIRGTERTGLHESAEASNGRLLIEQLEMTNHEAVRALRDRLSAHQFDVLFVNAGVANGAED
jgi:hypothetical protein